MKNVITMIATGVLVLSATTVTAGYERTSFFESVRSNTTVSQEASYQLGLETLRSITRQAPSGLSELSRIFLREDPKGSAQIQSENKSGSYIH